MTKNTPAIVNVMMAAFARQNFAHSGKFTSGGRLECQQMSLHMVG
jgi:hypothetical protein